MSKLGTNNLLPQQSELVLGVINGRLVSINNGRNEPEEIPRIGKKILLSTHPRPYKSMCVGDHGRIADGVQLFDTLYYEWGHDVIIVQILPTDNPNYGIIRYLDTQPLEVNLLGEHRLSSSYGKNHRHRQEGN